jgi:hypothetical protein
VLRPKPPREVVIGSNRPGAIARAVEQVNALPQQALIEVGKLRGALGELQRSREVAVVFGLLRKLLRAFTCQRAKSMPLTAEPIVELGRAVCEETLQQRSTI